tara:strand:- start:309 stop:896 length:588 start_codon:yes stop_codon:yes gene_type:complete
MKKGAMFGLDARIALAIFGALSVISGAALYSAIQQSKVISIVTQISEITKAYEQYYLDTGNSIRKSEDINSSLPNKSYGLGAIDLIENSGANGWDGPYISIKKLNEMTLLYDGIYYTLIRADTGVWGSPGSSTVSCSVKTTCNFWVQVLVKNENIAKQIDLHYDGTETLDSGLVRIRADAKTTVFYNTGIKYTGI